MKKQFSIPAFLFGPFLSAAVTPVQTTSYTSGEIYETDDLVDGLGWIGFFEEQSLTGFQKFDPSLGELEEVRLTITGSAYLEMTIFSDALEDPELPFTAIFESDFEESDDLIDVGLTYNPSGTNLIIGPGLEFLQPGSLGFEGEDPADWTFDTFYFEDYFSEDFFFYDGVDNPPLEVTIRMDEANVNPADFRGEGEVTGLAFEVYLSLIHI